MEPNALGAPDYAGSMANTKERLGLAEVMAELEANGSAQTRKTYRNAGREAPEMRGGFFIVSTCSSALRNAARAVRQASRRCSAFEGLKCGSGPNATLGRAICLMPCGKALT